VCCSEFAGEGQDVVMERRWWTGWIWSEKIKAQGIDDEKDSASVSWRKCTGIWVGETVAVFGESESGQEKASGEEIYPCEVDERHP
jgi:hypothetical protein